MLLANSTNYEGLPQGPGCSYFDTNTVVTYHLMCIFVYICMRCQYTFKFTLYAGIKVLFVIFPKNKGTIIEFNSQSPQAHGYNSTPVRTGYPGTQVSVNSVLIMPMNKIISSVLD